MLIFPPTPAVNDKFPDPVVAGTPQWQWDGVRWVALGAAAGLADAPSDGFTYGRRNATWVDVPTAAGNRTPIMTQIVVAGTPVGFVDFFYDFTTFDQYLFEIYAAIPTAGVPNLALRISFNGTTFDATNNYHYAQSWANSSNAGGSGGQAGYSLGYVGNAVASGGRNAGQYTIHFALPGRTNFYKYFISTSGSQNAAGIFSAITVCGHIGTAGLQPLQGIRFLFESGQISEGVFNLYGVYKV